MRDHSPYDKNTGKKLPLGTEGSHVKSYYWIKNNWPHDRTTGKKLEWGTKGSNIITTIQRRLMKSRLIYAQDDLAPDGHVLHKKGSPIAPRTQVQKWGPGTLYIVGPQIDKPPKRKKALKTAVASKKKMRGAGAVASPVTNDSESLSPTGTGIV